MGKKTDIRSTKVLYILLLVCFNVHLLYALPTYLIRMDKEGMLVKEFTIDRIIALIFLVLLYVLVNVYYVIKIRRVFKQKTGEKNTGVGDNFILDKKIGKGLSLLLYLGEDKNLKIPGRRDGRPLVKIDSYAIANNCLETAELADSIVSICSGAIFYCEHLVSVKLPAKLKHVDGNPFIACKKLKEIIVPKENRNFEVSDGILYEIKSKRLISYPCNCETEIFAVPDTVSTIASYAFAYNEFIEEVVLPDSIVSIEVNPFKVCTNLKRISLSENNPLFGFVDGILYEKSSRRLISYCGEKAEVHIPEGIVTIGEESFIMNGWLKKVVLPNTVRTLEKECFSFCDSLTEIVLPEGLISIKEKAFNELYDLDKLVLPRSVTFIDERAFDNTPDVKLMVYKNSYAERYARKNKIDYSYIEND